MQTDLYKYKTEPYQHQIDAITKIADTPFHALFMEQGTGKTKTEIDYVCNMWEANRLDACIVLAPNGVHEQWYKDEIPKHCFAPSALFLWRSDAMHKRKLTAWIQGMKASNKVNRRLLWLCVNIESFSQPTYLELHKTFLKTFRTHVVEDEATSIKNPDAKRTVNVINGLSDLVLKTSPRGKKIIVGRNPCSVSRAILTGTPETKGPYGLWSMFEFLQYNFFGRNYYSFKATYGMEKQVWYPGAVRATSKAFEARDFKTIRERHAQGMSVQDIAISLSFREQDVQYIIDNPDVVTPYKNLGELKKMMDPYTVIVRKADCLDLPKKIKKRVYVEMTPEQKALYKSVIAQAYAMYEKRELTVANKAAMRIRLHQIAGGFFPATHELYGDLELSLKLAETEVKPIGRPEKAKVILNDLEEASEFPKIIATAYRAEAEYMYEACKAEGYRTALIYGGVDKYERRKIMEQYNAHELDIITATEKTIAYGFNMQAGSTIYHYSNLDGDTETRLQLEARIDRIGQIRNPRYVDIITKGTIDESILEVIEGNAAFQEYMLSNDPSDFFKYIKAEEEKEQEEKLI